MKGKYQSVRTKQRRPLLFPALLLCCAGLLAVLFLVHPADSEGGIGTIRTPRTMERLETLVTEASAAVREHTAALRAQAEASTEQIAANPAETAEPAAEPEPEPEPEPARKTYTIADDALCGEVPNPECYGSSADPDEVEAVIAAAAELLDGQETAWNRDLPFRSGTETSWYFDETILVLTWQESVRNVTYYCSEVKVADPSQFRRMLSGNTYGASQQLKCSTMASAANAVLASNADFYMYRSSGINVWQGQLYRFNAKLDTCFIDDNGDLLVTHASDLTTEEEALTYIEEHNVNFSLAFGPILVENGVPITNCNYSIGQIEQTAARAAIGQLGELHYIMMNVNYTTVLNVAAAMAEKNVVTAYCLDGGQTGETVFGGKIFNRVVYDAERNVSDIIYFATALPSGEE